MLTATLGSLVLAAFPLGTLFYLAIAFFVISILAWAMGAGGVAGMSAGVGRMLLWVFLVLAIILIVLNFAGVGVTTY